ncbi:hypothetical protein A8C32_09890 [Flavivirga aquatica]|uniref:Uncharacterized protein n=1 Tax=Flavivirga aquatica TaxID=1849968 RepID=A0A1E5TEL5_9FLAO|nr:type VI secretion system protein TssR domain-containing protein [Flavivirga aquatica]OEK09812.1 hypothetical protein A8C32_09890 [Flavivirga aquatica]
MRLFNKKYLVLLVCCLQQLIYGQVKNYTKVDKIYRDTYNFLESANARKKQYKDRSLYVVYSDREDNNSYLDDLGLKQGEPQKFLTPYFVINETSDFLELVKFDPTQIGKPKGIFSLFYGEKYNFKDTKNVTYVGWVQRDKLLHFSHPKISEANLKPIVYYLGINKSNTLFDLRKHIKKDSVITYKDPSLKIKSKKTFNTNQLVYLYKYNANKTAALVSNLEHMRASDSLKRTMGWVPSQLVKNIGQGKVWKIKEGEDVLFTNPDSTKYAIKSRDISSPFLFKPEEKYKQKTTLTTDSLPLTTHALLNIWDHYNNKLVNVKGSDVYLREIPIIKEENKVFNFHFIFDCSDNLREKLILQISSLQHIWLLLTEDKRFKGKKFTFSASSYGCGKYYRFPKNDSFALWVDYLQSIFLKDDPIITKEYNREGIEKCFLNIIDNNPDDKNFENNIVIVMGEGNLDFEIKNDDILYDLAKISSRMLFFQLDNTSNKKHQDYILKSKQILDAIGKEYRNYITNYVIDNKLEIKQNLFSTIESNEDNIYLYDAPKNSMYVGGLVFPKINKSLTPLSFDVALDSLLSRTIASNDTLLKSLQKGAENLGFLRSLPTKRMTNILKDDSLKRSALLIPKTNRLERYLETSKLNLKDNKTLESGYLFSKKELDVILESYKSVVPLIDKNVKRRERRKLYKKYKSYYKQLNKLLFYKELRKRNTIGELVKIKTGIKVSDSLLNTIKIKEIKRKSKLSNKKYINLMHYLRTKITRLETVMEDPLRKTFIDGSKKTYYYVSEKSLL